jgi:hypothetical protein
LQHFSCIEKTPGSTVIQLYVGVTLRMPDTAGGGGYRGIQEETPDPEAVVKICRLLKTEQSSLLAHSFYLKTLVDCYRNPVVDWCVCRIRQ